MNIAWTIAGIDSSGGAGVHADILTFQHLNVHACSIATAVTAQNPQDIHALNVLSVDEIETQWQALMQSMSPAAIKIGMLGNVDIIRLLKKHLASYAGKLVLDPLLISSSGKELFNSDGKEYVKHLISLFPHTDLLTPNLPEAEFLLNKKIVSYADIIRAAQELLLLGAKSVVIKGGHFNDNYSHDYWTDGKESFWLSSPRFEKKNYRGTGCVFSSALTACLASGYELKDALVVAKMYINRGIRLAHHQNADIAYLHHGHLPDHQNDLPYLLDAPIHSTPPAFSSCEHLGLYPIVENSERVEKLLLSGVKTIQLRIKNGIALEDEIKRAIDLAKQYDAQLFINDYWELALQHGAYGVHLGQEDLSVADINKIRAAGLRLGISTHCYYEVARAHGYRPSYMACGPIFPTTSKIMPFNPQGIERLAYWKNLLSDYPLVAIGGINESNIQDVWDTGVDGVAMISAAEKLCRSPDECSSHPGLAGPHINLQKAKITPDEKSTHPGYRYSRQINLPQVGLEGQIALKNAKVLCIGAGGLGTPLLLYLAAAGVGTLGIVDDDRVEISNLHRQILYHEKDIGHEKVQCAADKLALHQSQIKLNLYNQKLTADNAEEIIKQYDIIADCSDNFATRFILNDICFHLDKPLVSASLLQFQGQCFTLSGKQGPCLRCLYPEPADNEFQNCEQGGVLGVVPGVLGMIQASEILKYVLKQGELLIGRVLMVDILNMQFQDYQLPKNPDCELCGSYRIIPDHQPRPERLSRMRDFIITTTELNELLKQNADLQLVDVRTLDKHQAYNIGGKHIPTAEIPERVNELDPEKLVVTYCTSGGNSMRALQYLLSVGFRSVKSLDGGMTAWQVDIR